MGAALLCLCPFPRAEAKEMAWTGNEWNVSEQEMKEVKNLKLGREDAKILVSGKLAPSQGSADYTMTFTVYGDGQILVKNTMTPEGFSARDLIPVVGNEMQLASQ